MNQNIWKIKDLKKRKVGYSPMAGKFLLYVNQSLDATSDKISSFSSHLKEEDKQSEGQHTITSSRFLQKPSEPSGQYLWKCCIFCPESKQALRSRENLQIQQTGEYHMSMWLWKPEKHTGLISYWDRFCTSLLATWTDRYTSMTDSLWNSRSAEGWEWESGKLSRIQVTKSMSDSWHGGDKL